MASTKQGGKKMVLAFTPARPLDCSPMNAFCRKCPRFSLLLGLLVILALLCSQGVALHVHNFGEMHGGELADAVDLGQLHSAYDLSHSEHHDGPVYDVDASPDGIVKKLSQVSLVLALFVFSLMLLVPPPGRVLFRRCKHKVSLLERHLFSPPLRAPPL